MRARTLISSALLLFSMQLTAPALADDVPCPPQLGRVTIDGNVVVRGECRLEGTRVIGNVHVYAGGSLEARDARVDGNIQAEAGSFVRVADSTVGGSIQLDNLAGGASYVDNTRVGGSIQLKDNQSRLDVTGNTVGADIQAFGNTGGLDFSLNRVDGNLQCKQNAPPPTGSANQVSGNSEDQCAALQPARTGGGGGSGSGSGGGSAGGRPVISGDVQCPPGLGAVAVDGNVLVSGDCRLEATRVIGNVLLYAGGSLTATEARVDGNVQAERAITVNLGAGTRVDGNVQLDGLVGGSSMVSDAVVAGNVQLDENRGPLRVAASRIGGDVQAFGNTGGVDITGNTIGGNLQCKGNDPAPTGGQNLVGGNREDQCAQLREAAASVGAAPGGTAIGGMSNDGGGGATGMLSLCALGLGLLAARRGRA